MSRRESRKIMIVMKEGSPNFSGAMAEDKEVVDILI
jgi:hypothetical protein